MGTPQSNWGTTLTLHYPTCKGLGPNTYGSKYHLVFPNVSMYTRHLQYLGSKMYFGPIYQGLPTPRVYSGLYLDTIKG